MKSTVSTQNVAGADDWRATFVEQVRVLGAEMGLSPTMSRMLGWLVVCQPPHQSAQQIQVALRLSAGSVSTGANALTNRGLAQRVSLPGDRHTYYKVVPDGWRHLVAARLHVLGEIRRIADNAMAAGGDRTDDRLRDMRDFHAWCEQRFTGLLDLPPGR